MTSRTSGHQLTPGQYYFDQISIGDWFETGTAEITSDLIRHYSELSGDTYQLHLDDEFAKSVGFPAMIAHGILVQGVADGLKFRSPINLDAVASLGWNIKYTKPVFVGDTIMARIRIVDKITTSNFNRGIAKLKFTIINQNKLIVQQGYNNLMMRRKKVEIDSADNNQEIA